MIVERIKEFIDYKGISIAAFERSIGMSNASFGKSLKNKGAIGTDKLENILNIYPDISPLWLLAGEGPMLKTSTSGADEAPCPNEKERKTKKSEKNSECSSRIQKLPEGSMEGIPLIPTSAMAGAFTSDISFMEYECEHYFIPDFKGADFLIRVKGDSMQPTYYSGDLVACQKIPMNDIFFQWNKTYVLDTNQGAIIKRVLPGKDDDHICIVSDNTKYPPFELEKSYLHAIALVRGIIRLE
jgi:phage repressor protein C with HTH and peptisase S24 domain